MYFKSTKIRTSKYIPNAKLIEPIPEYLNITDNLDIFLKKYFEHTQYDCVTLSTNSLITYVFFRINDKFEFNLFEHSFTLTVETQVNILNCYNFEHDLFRIGGKAKLTLILADTMI
jgi:hypothetical protein